MLYTVLTSDGALHDTDSAEQFVLWLVELDVVDHSAPADAWTDLARAAVTRIIEGQRLRPLGRCA